jgi:transposase-like protein
MKPKPRNFIKDPVARANFWNSHVKGFSMSGKTLRAYCEDYGISQNTLRDWCNKQKRSEPVAERKSALETIEVQSNYGQFLQVQVCDAEHELVGYSQLKPQQIEITELQTPAGFRISLALRLDTNEFIKLLSNLKEAGC